MKGSQYIVRTYPEMSQTAPGCTPSRGFFLLANRRRSSLPPRSLEPGALLPR